MGYWMPDITKEPTLAQKIDFARDAGGIHLYWADRIRTDPASVPEEFGSAEFQEECAILHGDTADELEELAKLKGEKQIGCLLPFMRRQAGC